MPSRASGKFALARSTGSEIFNSCEELTMTLGSKVFSKSKCIHAGIEVLAELAFGDPSGITDIATVFWSTCGSGFHLNGALGA